MAPRSTTAPTAGILALTAIGAASLAATLAEIAASETGQVALTQEQGSEALAAGFIELTGNADANGLAPAKLTDAGFAKFQENEAAGVDGSDAATAPASAPASAKVAFKVSAAVPIPTEEGVRRGRSNGYPFATMEVGESFHVAPTEEYPDPAERLASSVSGARARFSKDTGKTEDVEVKVYAKDAHGKFVKDGEGKRVVASTKTETRPVMEITKDFMVRAVDASDPDGVGARVWRTA